MEVWLLRSLCSLSYIFRILPVPVPRHHGLESLPDCLCPEQIHRGPGSIPESPPKGEGKRGGRRGGGEERGEGGEGREEGRRGREGGRRGGRGEGIEDRRLKQCICYVKDVPVRWQLQNGQGLPRPQHTDEWNCLVYRTKRKYL